MTRKSKPDVVQINVAPPKRFFVEMLTRDIEPDDAILDLLDNCVDGILRHHPPKAGVQKPYDGFWAKITLSPKQFSIVDNCGGIERQVATEYAFRFGRPKSVPDSNLPTVGMYGIGMKRSILRLGSEGSVISRTRDDAFEVTISPQWLKDDQNWDLPLQSIVPPFSQTGTEVGVSKLHSPIKLLFGKDSDFEERLRAKLSTHYSYIMHKGFKVHVNGAPVKAQPIQFLFDAAPKTESRVAPFLYEGTRHGVKIRLAVGFYGVPPTDDEVDEEMETRHSREEAGWTIICNDRVVVHNDRTRLTGWGEADVPNFHSQFRTIAGLVVFESSSPLDLPLNTTKRGLNAASDVYLYVKNYMREGMKIFTQYTYKLKTRPKEERHALLKSSAADPTTISTAIEGDDWTRVRSGGSPDEKKFIPELPMPKKANEERFLRFSRPLAKIRRLGELLLNNAEAQPGEIGGAAFDETLKRLSKAES